MFRKHWVMPTLITFLAFLSFGGLFYTVDQDHKKWLASLTAADWTLIRENRATLFVGKEPRRYLLVRKDGEIDLVHRRDAAARQIKIATPPACPMPQMIIDISDDDARFLYKIERVVKPDDTDYQQTWVRFHNLCKQ